MKKGNLEITHKGIAVVSAIQSGLCPKIEGGWDTDAFEKFWEKYKSDLKEYRQKLPRRLRLRFDEQCD